MAWAPEIPRTLDLDLGPSRRNWDGEATRTQGTLGIRSPGERNPSVRTQGTLAKSRWDLRHKHTVGPRVLLDQGATLQPGKSPPAA